MTYLMMPCYVRPLQTNLQLWW